MSVSINIIRVRGDADAIADVGEDAFEAFGAPAELAARLAREVPGCSVERHATTGAESWAGVHVDAETGSEYEVDFVRGADGDVAIVVVRPPAGSGDRMRAALWRVISAIARAVGGIAFTDDGERFDA